MLSTPKKISSLPLKPIERTALRAFSRRLKKALGRQLVSVLLFGSKARGAGRGDSDIDIFVLIRRQTIRSRSTVARVTSAVWWDYDVLLSPVTYDLEEREKNVRMGSFFFESVGTEGIKI